MRSLLFLPITLLFFTRLAGQAYQNSDDKRINQFYVGFEGSLFYNFSHFETPEFIDGRLKKPPFFSFSAGLSLHQNISKNLSLVSGIALINIGYKHVFYQSYSISRWRYRTIMNSSFSLFKIPLLISYKIPIRNIKPYFSLGPDLLYSPNSLKRGVLSGSKSEDPASGSTFVISSRRHPSPKFSWGLHLEAGVEKEIRNWKFNLGAVYNKGFNEVAIWDNEYKTWEISESIDGKSFKNKIINRGSNIGLRIAVLYGL